MKIQALLLPAQLRERPSPAFRALRVALIVLPFVAFAWIGVRWVNTQAHERALDAALVPLRSARAERIAAIRALVVPPADAARVEASVAALNATTSAGAGGVVDVLPALEEALPAGSGLEGLTAKPQGSGLRLTLKGAAADHAGLAQVADRLGRVNGMRLRGWAVRPTGALEWTAEGDQPVSAR